MVSCNTEERLHIKPNFNKLPKEGKLDPKLKALLKEGNLDSKLKALICTRLNREIYYIFCNLRISSIYILRNFDVTSSILYSAHHKPKFLFLFF